MTAKLAAKRRTAAQIMLAIAEVPEAAARRCLTPAGAPNLDSIELGGFVCHPTP